MEIWVDVIGYEGMYEVSNLGNVRSIDRMVVGARGKCKRIQKGKPKKQVKTTRGYWAVHLYKDNNHQIRTVHLIVYESFNGIKPNGLVIDHIDNDKLNNRLDNLRAITNRENISKGFLLKKRKYKFTGVSKSGKKWRARMQINGIYEHLGTYNCETAAHLAYERKLKEIENEKQNY